MNFEVFKISKENDTVYWENWKLYALSVSFKIKFVILKKLAVKIV